MAVLPLASRFAPACFSWGMAMPRRSLLLLSLSLLSLSWSAPVLAAEPELPSLAQQVIPPQLPEVSFTAPATLEPEQLAQRIVPPGLRPPRPDLTPLPDTLKPSEPPPQLTPPPQPQPVPPSESSEVRVQIRDVQVLGSTVFSAATLAEVVAPFIGQSATFEDLLALRTAITNLYTRNGYATSGAFLPPQDITRGVIKVQVVEGELERIDIRGLKRLRPSYVRERIALADRPPLNLQRLEQALQLLQLSPLFSSVQAELTAGSSPGRSVLILTLQEASPWDSSLTVENLDAPSVGSIGGTAAVSHNNVLGLGDRFGVDVHLTAGVLEYNFGYQIPLNARNGTLSLSYDYNSNRIVEEPFADLGINSRSETFTLGFRQPLIQTPTTELATGLALDLRQSRTFINEDQPFSFSLGPEDGRSRVTVLRWSQDWIRRSRNRVLAARSQLNFGLEAFDATVNNTGVDGRFFSWVGQVQWVQAFSPRITTVARVATQFTNDALLPLEQFSIGGVETVRGYEQNQRTGDSGFAGTLEARFTVVDQASPVGTIQVVPFFDVGTVWNNQGEILSPNTLASLGIGLRWQPWPYLSARLDWGYPLIGVDNSGHSLQDLGLFFSITFVPF